MITASKKILKLPCDIMDAATTVDKPVAGPDTLSCDPLTIDTSIPPIIPEIIPTDSGAPDASAIPKHKGNATRKTDNPAGKSCLSQISR